MIATTNFIDLGGQEKYEQLYKKNRVKEGRYRRLIKFEEFSVKSYNRFKTGLRI